jgi:hypothetical protein
LLVKVSERECVNRFVFLIATYAMQLEVDVKSLYRMNPKSLAIVFSPNLYAMDILGENPMESIVLSQKMAAFLEFAMQSEITKTVSTVQA